MMYRIKKKQTKFGRCSEGNLGFALRERFDGNWSACLRFANHSDGAGGADLRLETDRGDLNFDKSKFAKE
jgi:hypothetical protein